MIEAVCLRFGLLHKLSHDVNKNDTNLSWFHSDKVVEAGGLQYQLSPSFVKTLFTGRYIFKHTKSASDYLQRSILDYSKAFEHLEFFEEKLVECRTDSQTEKV